MSCLIKSEFKNIKWSWLLIARTWIPEGKDLKNVQKSLRALTPEISGEDEDPYAVESWMVHGALDMAKHLAKNVAPVLPWYASNVRFLLHAPSLPVYQRINYILVCGNCVAAWDVFLRWKDSYPQSILYICNKIVHKDQLYDWSSYFMCPCRY